MTTTLRLALTIALGSSPALAQDYPSKPMTMVVGFAASGFADTLARTFGSKLSERLDKNVISFHEVLNKNRTFALDELNVVAIPAWAPETLSVAPNYSAKTLAELIQAGRSKSVSFAAPGAGTASQ